MKMKSTIKACWGVWGDGVGFYYTQVQFSEAHDQYKTQKIITLYITVSNLISLTMNVLPRRDIFV
jgi:hypothetical protein